MNQQLKIHIDQSNNRTIDSLTLQQQYVNGRAYPITQASGIVYGATGLPMDILTTFDTSGFLSITGDESNGLLYNWQPLETATLTQYPKSSYHVLWNLNNGDRILDRYCDVVFWKLLNPITEYDILLEKPELERYRPESNLVATQASSGTSLVCDTLYQPSEFFNGSIIEFKGGNNDSFHFLVDSWSSITRSFVLATPVLRPINPGDKFTLRRSFKPEIDSAWLEIQNTIQSWVGAFVTESPVPYYFPRLFGVFPPPIKTPTDAGLQWAIDGTDFRQMHLNRTMINISLALKIRSGDVFDIWYEYYNEKFGVAFSELEAKVDLNRDGIYNGQDGLRRGVIWASN
jgi:hypothetical protein